MQRIEARNHSLLLISFLPLQRAAVLNQNSEHDGNIQIKVRFDLITPNIKLDTL
jgi:hypothetical protein